MSIIVRQLTLFVPNYSGCNKCASNKLVKRFSYFTLTPKSVHILKRDQTLKFRRVHNFVHQKLLGRYLFLTNTISSSVLMAIGDFIQQQIESYKKGGKRDSYDYRRTRNMAIIGLVLGPIQHFLYKYIDALLPKRTFKSVVKKILIDQSIGSTISIAIFFYGLGLLEDGNIKQAHEELKHKCFKIYMVDCCVWPFSQFINFTYVPSKYRVVYINCVTMVYNVFLSYIKHEVPHPKNHP